LWLGQRSFDKFIDRVKGIKDISDDVFLGYLLGDGVAFKRYRRVGGSVPNRPDAIGVFVRFES
jgi:hypothetical protein